MRNKVFYISETGQVYYIRQLRPDDSLALDWVIWEFGPERRIDRTVHVTSARYTQEKGWQGQNIEIHDFRGKETNFVSLKESALTEVKETPEEIAVRSRQTDEMNVIEIKNYVSRMKAAGSNVAVELVDYHFRFSSPLIIVIVTIISLSTATLLHKGNITLGIGFGLLLSFLYWGAMQASRAFGYAGVMPAWLSAWLPNILFSALSGVLLVKVKR